MVRWDVVHTPQENPLQQYKLEDTSYSFHRACMTVYFKGKGK